MLGGNFRGHSHGNKDFTVKVFLYGFYPPRTSDEFDRFIEAAASSNIPVKDECWFISFIQLFLSVDWVLIVSSLFRFVSIDKMNILFIWQFNSFLFFTSIWKDTQDEDKIFILMEDLIEDRKK